MRIIFLTGTLQSCHVPSDFSSEETDAEIGWSALSLTELGCFQTLLPAPNVEVGNSLWWCWRAYFKCITFKIRIKWFSLKCFWKHGLILSAKAHFLHLYKWVVCCVLDVGCLQEGYRHFAGLHLCALGILSFICLRMQHLLSTHYPSRHSGAFDSSGLGLEHHRKMRFETH